MNQALWLLLRLQAKGWIRRTFRSLKSVKGVLLLIVGLLIIGSWLVAILMSPHQRFLDPETIRLYAPLGILVSCLLTTFLASGEPAIYFSPGEVNFLFAGPFNRRQILIYKIMSVGLLTTVSALIFSMMLRPYAQWLLAGYVGLALTLLFFQLFAMFVQMFVLAIGAHAYNRGRKLFVGLLIAGACVILLRSGVLQEGGLTKLAHQLEQSSTWRVMSFPLRCFADAFLAQRGDWAELATNASIALLVNAGLVVLIIVLDANYLEAAAASSERLYKFMDRMKRGEATGLSWKKAATKASIGIPNLPYWGGIGPIAWRQLTTALRSWSRIIFTAGIFFLIMIVPLFTGDKLRDVRSATMQIVSFMGMWTIFFIPTMLPYDFRGDLDRMDLLKTLPIPAWRLAIGQLLAPLLLILIMQALVVAIALIALGQWNQILLTAILLMVPIGFLVLGLENLTFLWFPTRVTNVQPGDFQSMGRSIILMFFKLLLLAVTVGVATIIAVLIYYLAGRHYWLSAITGCFVVSCFGLSLVPMIASAFHRLDVSRDLPQE